MNRYHGPYVDASEEKFYLPKKWRHLNEDQQWQQCDVDYSFKIDEVNGGDLICNLRWLGNYGKLMKLVNVHEAPPQSISSDKDE